MEKQILVTRSSMPDYNEYCDEIKQIFESHYLTNGGPIHNKFKQQLEEYCGGKVELFTNGHQALLVALQALELKGEVITTPFTFASTTHSIVASGLTPVFCDIKDDYTIDEDKIESLITEKTSAIMPVHVYGNICNVDKIQKIADKYGLKVIYDAAHAFGEKKDGKNVATFGDVSMFSFHATKVFNTIEGGCLVLKDEKVQKKIAKIRNFGISGEDVEYVGRLVTLNVNYRSVAPVLNAYNIFYNRELIGMREKVKPSKVKFSDKYQMFNDKDVFFVDVKNGKEATEGTSRYNVEELRATREILEMLLENTLNSEKVSVSAIFPYGAQIDKFQRENKELINKARKTFKSFEIDTVDAFQGRETDIVLVNTVVTDMSRGNFLNDFRRINVSMSRARDKLFIFGNPTTLSNIDMKVSSGGKRRYFADIIDDIKRFGQSIKFDGGIDYEFTSKPKIKII